MVGKYAIKQKKPLKSEVFLLYCKKERDETLHKYYIIFR